MKNIPEHARKMFSWIIFDVYHWEQELYDGSTTTFEALHRKGTAIVLPVLDNGNFLLCIQEQPGYSKRLDAFGGRQDDDEDLLTTAKRELLEESWYEAQNYELIIEENPRAPKVQWSICYFIARGLKRVSGQKLDAGEKLELFEMSKEDFFNKNFPKWVDVWEDIETIWEYLSKNKI